MRYLILPNRPTYAPLSDDNVYNNLGKLSISLGEPVPIPEDGSSYEMCVRWSAALFSLSRPVSIREPQDVSVFAIGIVKHPDPSSLPDPDESSALVYDNSKIYINSTTPDYRYLQYLLPYFAPQVEVDDVIAYIESKKGRKINPKQLIPPSMLPLKTENYMENRGWFAEQV